jgi:hypothetical protein
MQTHQHSTSTPLPRRNEVDLGRPLRAHDIRKLRTCRACDGIGFAPHMLEGVFGPSVRPEKPELYHGACVVQLLSREQILALPAEERNKLRLSETGPDLMRALMDAMGSAA